MKIGLRLTARLAAPLLAAASLTLVAMPAAQAAAPSNDDFASAQTLLTGVTTAGTNVDATAEVGEPDPQDDGGNGNGTEATVWYEWTAPTSGSFIATTASSDIDTYLAVFTGSSVDSLTPVHEDDDDPISDWTFTATAGTTYYLQVDGYHDDQTETGAVAVAVMPSTVLSGHVTLPARAEVSEASLYNPITGREYDAKVDLSTGTYEFPSVLPGHYLAGFFYAAGADGGMLFYGDTTDINAAAILTIASGCTYHNLNADVTTEKVSGPTGSCTPACVSAKRTASSDASALGAERATVAADAKQVASLQSKANNALKALNKAKHKHNTKAIKRATKLKKQVGSQLAAAKRRLTADNATASAAASASNGATAASTAACA